MSASTIAPPLPVGWVLATSKSTGKNYYFETKTGRSLYTHPSLLVTVEGGLQVKDDTVIVSTGIPAAPSILSSSDELAVWTTRVNMAVSAANGDVLLLRKAVDTICARLSNSRSAHPHHFPVLDKFSRSVVHERIEDAGLKSESIGEDSGRHIVMWNPSCTPPPPEVAAKAAAEVALAVEAANLKAAEVVAAREAAIAARAAGVARKRGRVTEEQADGEAGVVEGEKPLLAPTRTSKKDGKDYAQIEKELAERKAKRMGGGGGKASNNKKDEEEEELAAG